MVIRASAIEDQLRIEIENDRPIHDQQSGERGEGVGLANARTRLATLYGSQGSMSFSTLETIVPGLDKVSFYHGRFGNGQR